MPRPKKRREEPAPIAADLMPVLSCMFLLIPALLLAMEVARMVSIPITAPRFAPSPGAPSEDQHDLRAAVHIRNDGIAVSTQAGDDDEIPLAAGGHDFGALQSWAKRIKAAHPDELAVTISADNDVELHTLIDAMDALRGSECKLAPMVVGEAPAPECLLWRPIVSSSPLG
jgi:biopolymer transport protein ExbD